MPASAVLCDRPPNILLDEDFSSLSIEDGQAPTAGARYVDSHVAWGVRRLANPPNLDQGERRYIAGQTHILTEQGLSLRAFPSDLSPTGYIASMISTERSLQFGPGVKITVPTAFPKFGPGLHFTHWLMPADGSVDAEYDLLELIGNNSHAPNGPVNSIFLNAKAPEGGSHSKWHDVPDGFLAEMHEYAFIWQRSGLEWFIDGEKVHEAPNLYDGPMFFMSTIELGASENGDFPGPVNEASVWPAEVVLGAVRIERV